MQLKKEKNNALMSITISLEEGENVVIDERDIIGDELYALVTIDVPHNATCVYHIIGKYEATTVKRVAKVLRNATMEWIEASVTDKPVESSISIELLAPGATGNLYSAMYAVKDAQPVVLHAVYHKAPHTVSALYTRGIAEDTSKMTYHSMIDIAEHVDDANGKQKADFLIASPKASVEAVPDLAIRHHAVQCSHGVSVTKLQDLPLFYLTSRGFSETEARKTVLVGHLTPMVEHMEDEKKCDQGMQLFQKTVEETYGN